MPKLSPGLGEGNQVHYLADLAPQPDKVKLGDAGRLVIPAAIREAMGVKPGDNLLLRVEDDGELRIIGQSQSIRRIQRYAQKFKKPGESVVDELIAERRAEAARESGEES